MQSLKNKIKKIIPRRIVNLLKLNRNYSSIFPVFEYLYNDHYFQYYKRDLDRVNSFSMKENSQITNLEQTLSSAIIIAHTIEKGMTMSNMTMGFGYERVIQLINLCKAAIENTKDSRFIVALDVLNQYLKIHKNLGFDLDDRIKEGIFYLNQRISNKDLSSIELPQEISKEFFFLKIDKQFDVFSASRRSVRDFKEEGDMDFIAIENAFKLAQNAPSTCNRQSTRVRLVKSQELLKNIIDLQGGNRGFGESIKTMIVLSSDIRNWDGGADRYGPYLDGGIYLMNLLYALHFYQVGACSLNWYSTLEKDNQLRTVLNIPENEVVFAMVACGLVKDKFKLAKSERINYKQILTIL